MLRPVTRACTAQGTVSAELLLQSLEAEYVAARHAVPTQEGVWLAVHVALVSAALQHEPASARLVLAALTVPEAAMPLSLALQLAEAASGNVQLVASGGGQVRTSRPKLGDHVMRQQHELTTPAGPARH